MGIKLHQTSPFRSRVSSLQSIELPSMLFSRHRCVYSLSTHLLHLKPYSCVHCLSALRTRNRISSEEDDTFRIKFHHSLRARCPWTNHGIEKSCSGRRQKFHDVSSLLSFTVM